jgi:hypothetical protein
VFLIHDSHYFVTEPFHIDFVAVRDIFPQYLMEEGVGHIVHPSALLPRQFRDSVLHFRIGDVPQVVIIQVYSRFRDGVA